MSSVTTALGASAPARTFEHAGKVYTISRVSQAMKSALEQWVVDCELAAMRKSLTAAEFRDVVREVRADVGKGVYSFYGPRTRAAMASPAGAVKFAALVFGCSEEEMERVAAARKLEVKALLEVTLAESLPKAEADGKEGGAAEAGGEAEANGPNG